jgi:hypothetical protein
MCVDKVDEVAACLVLFPGAGAPIGVCSRWYLAKAWKAHSDFSQSTHLSTCPSCLQGFGYIIRLFLRCPETPNIQASDMKRVTSRPIQKSSCLFKVNAGCSRRSDPAWHISALVILIKPRASPSQLHAASLGPIHGIC